MDKIELARRFFKLIESKDFDALEDILTEDFLYYGPTPDPFDRETWLRFQRAVQAAFPDWAYNIQNMEWKGNEVEVTVHITATHTKPLSLPLAGFKTLPPTHKKIEMPLEHALLSFHGDKVKSLNVEKQFHGSLPGLLQQLGLE